MTLTQQCVLPEECGCEVAGVRYWAGQQIKVDCEICVCERGRPQRCQPNPDCSGGNEKLKVLWKIHGGWILIYTFVILQCSVAGHRGRTGESVWGPAVFRVSSGHSAAQTIQPSTETGEHVEGFTGKPAGM